jgi:hypothetical protein
MTLLAALACLVLQGAPAPAAPPQPAAAPPAQAAPAAKPTEPGAKPADAAPAAEPTKSADPAAAGSAPPALSGDPRQVWVYIDRWKEFGGTVLEETELDITVFDGHEKRTFRKAKVLDIVDIVKPKPGQHGMIQLRDGTVVRGEILRDSLEEVEFKVDSVRGKLPREQVYRVLLEMDFDARYARLKGAIAPEEHGRRLGLARWLTDQGRLDLAIAELESLLRDADIDEARDMLRDVTARVKLAQSIEGLKHNGTKKSGSATKPGKDAPTPTPAGGTDAPGQATPTQAAPPAPGNGTEDPAATPEVAPHPPTNKELLPKDLLSNEDVNLVRVYEIDFKDPPRLTVPPEGVRQLILRYGSSSLIPATTQERNALYSRSGIDLARLFFDLKARDLYSYIEVDEDPPSIAKFRTRVHNSWLISNCATSRCHGGIQAGRFFLYTGNAKDQRIRYTNLLTLLNLKVDGRPMVNFEDPPNSLLIQYATARNLARYPHPDIKGWKPVFNQQTPQLLADTLDWIRSMYQPRPEYPVKYVPPRLNAPDKPVRDPGGPDR